MTAPDTTCCPQNDCEVRYQCTVDQADIVMVGVVSQVTWRTVDESRSRSWSLLTLWRPLLPVTIRVQL